VSTPDDPRSTNDPDPLTAEYLRTVLREHQSQWHIDLTAEEARAKIDEHDDMIESMGRIVDLLEGTPSLDLQGNVIGREGGMAARQEGMAATLDTIYERTNGGVKVTSHISPEWTRGQKIAAFGIGTTVVLASLPGLVNFLRWVAELLVIS